MGAPTEKDNLFHRWWVTHKGRPPAPEDRAEYELAQEMWEGMWTEAGINPALPVVAQPDTARDQLLLLAQQLHQLFPPLVTAVWEDWFRAKVPDWALERDASAALPLDANEHRRLVYRALRSESEEEFLVARMRPGSQIAKLDDVEDVICEIKTTPGNDTLMRIDYRAAEAFAALLTALPDLIRMREHLEVLLGMRLPPHRGALPPEDTDDKET